MGLIDKIGLPVWRKCPAGRWHRVSSDHPDCGHTGKVLEWCEPYQRWVANPTKTEEALRLIETSEEFDVEREARLRIEEALKKGDLQPAMDYRRRIME